MFQAFTNAASAYHIRCADDWVLLLYLVGNDFIPHLPNLHIDKGGLPMLFVAYKKLLEAEGACVWACSGRPSVSGDSTMQRVNVVMPANRE